MRWSVEQRLRFIESTLAKKGRINRADIMEAFRVSLGQAAHDLAEYRMLAPGNLNYDASAKAYARAETFEKTFDGKEASK